MEGLSGWEKEEVQQKARDDREKESKERQKKEEEKKRKEKKREEKKTATGDALNKTRTSVESAKAPRRRFEGCKAVHDYEQQYPKFESVRFYSMCLL